MYNQIIFALLICFSISFSANGQISIYGSAGISSTGVNFSTDISQTVIFENESYIQPFLTFGVAAPLNKKLYWLGELSYSPSGFQRLNNNEVIVKTRYNMFNFQTGLGYQLGILRIETGGFIGTSLSDQFKNESGDWVNDVGLSEDFNAGAFIGLNLSVTKNIGIFTRYYRGLTPNSKIYFTDFNGVTINSISEKINNLQFGVSVRLI